MNTPFRPPGFLERLARLALAQNDREEALGDLHEEYRLIASKVGKGAASRWYSTQIVRALGLRFRSFHVGSGAGAVRHLRLAFRSIRRAPVRSTILASILAGGIGASTAIFSVVDQVLLQPLPYSNPHELHSVWNVYPAWEGDPVLDDYWRQVTMSWEEYRDIRDGSTTIGEVAAYGFIEAVINEPGDPVRAWVGVASSNLFALLGVEAHSGRLLAPEEAGDDAPLVALVSHQFWRERLAGDPNISGSTVRIDDRRFEIVGVLPKTFSLRGQSPFGAVSDPDLWVPAGSARPLGSRGDRSYEVIARTKTSVPLPVLGEELTRLVWGEDPEDGRGVRVTARHSEEVAAARAPLALLMSAALLMLVVVGSNVTTLRIGSVTAREREWATRTALGARRSHLRQQLLFETMLFGGVGLVGGAALAHVVLASWDRLTPPDLLLGVDVHLDARALAFGGCAALLVSLVAAWLPLLRIRDGAMARVAGHRGVSPGRSAGLLQRGLLASQVALSVVLLAGAGLFLRSLNELNAVDPGFNTDGLVTLRVEPSARSFQSADEFLDFHDRLASRIAAIPGVAGVSATNYVPFGEGLGSTSFGIESRVADASARSPEALRRSVRSGFFEILGIPLLEGRILGEQDGRNDPSVAVVSRSLAEAYWPGSSPIGDAILRDNRTFEVVGIVGDVRRSGLSSDPEPTYYTPLEQEPVLGMDVVVRLETGPELVSEALRAAVWAEDPTIPLSELEPLAARVRLSMRSERFRSMVTTFFGLSSVVLVALGLFGVALQAAVRRTREVGVRIALGATRSEVSSLIVSRELRVVWIGVTVGLALTLLGGRVVSGFLYGVRPHDPWALLTAASSLIVVATIAVWLPARRATRLDPSQVLSDG